MHTKQPPEKTDDSNDAISPCMWNKGIILSPLSSLDKERIFAMFEADDKIFLVESWTCFGFDVVPDVWRIKHWSLFNFGLLDIFFFVSIDLSFNEVSPSPVSMKINFVFVFLAAFLRLLEAVSSVTTYLHSRSFK